jgi:hypothetical protein
MIIIIIIRRRRRRRRRRIPLQVYIILELVATNLF